MRIQIYDKWKRLDGDGELCQRVWAYDIFTDMGASSKIRVVLSNYSYETRPTARHKWRPVNHWSRLMPRSSNMSFEDVPRPQNEMALVKAEIMKRIVLADSPR